MGIVLLALFVAHALLLRPVLQNGDSAVYNAQIESRLLNIRTTHIGYIALGIVFDVVLPFATDLNMNVMVLVLGTVGLSGVYACARTLSGSRLASIASAFLALLLPSQLQGMLLSEVDVVSAALVAASYACFLRAHPRCAGLLFGYAVLVTPLSGPLLAVFGLTIPISRGAAAPSLLRQARRLLVFGAAACIVYLPPVLVHYQDYVHGPRGLLNAPSSIDRLPDRIEHSFLFIGHELGSLLPVYVLGLCACVLNSRLWRLGQPALALVASIALMSVVGERFSNVPVQLPNLLLLAALPAVALSVTRWTMVIGLLLELGLGQSVARQSYISVLAAIERGEWDRSLCNAIREQSRPHAAVLVGLTSWARKRMFERYASGGAPQVSAVAVDVRELTRSRKRWLAAEPPYQFWFFRPADARNFGPLRGDYSLEERAVRSRSFRVLIPTRK